VFAGRVAAVAAARAAADRLRQLEAENAARSLDAQVEIPIELWRAAALAGRSTKGVQVALNRFKARVRHFFNWAIAEGDRDDTPFILAFAERVLPRASDLWVQASLDYKQRLQLLFFPEGIAFDGIQSNRRNGATFQLLGAGSEC
jgi:hypothetical protein